MLDFHKGPVEIMHGRAISIHHQHHQGYRRGNALQRRESMEARSKKGEKYEVADENDRVRVDNFTHPSKCMFAPKAEPSDKSAE